MYYWYNISTGQFLGAGPNQPEDADVGYTEISPQIGQYYDFDLGFTKNAFWTGTEWEYRDAS